MVDRPDITHRGLQFDICWLVTFNSTKTENILNSHEGNEPVHPPLLMNDQPIIEVSSHKHLGLFLSIS